MIGHSTGVVGGIPRALVLSYLLVLFQPSLFGRIVGLLSLIPFYSLLLCRSSLLLVRPREHSTRETLKLVSLIAVVVRSPGNRVQHEAVRCPKAEIGFGLKSSSNMKRLRATFTSAGYRSTLTSLKQATVTLCASTA
jgi:hypothetical protein